jgi:hypothetical protein
MVEYNGLEGYLHSSIYSSSKKTYYDDIWESWDSWEAVGRPEVQRRSKDV